MIKALILIQQRNITENKKEVREYDFIFFKKKSVCAKTFDLEIFTTSRKKKKEKLLNTSTNT
jgi:hypothetical protein